jgi:hypothetical protein
MKNKTIIALFIALTFAAVALWASATMALYGSLQINAVNGQGVPLQIPATLANTELAQIGYTWFSNIGATECMGCDYSSGGGGIEMNNFGTAFIQNHAPTAPLIVRGGTGPTGVLELQYGSAGGVNIGGFSNPGQGKVTVTGTVFANLGAQPGGTLTWCQDCTPLSNPCLGAGTGAWAFQTSALAWNCPF